MLRLTLFQIASFALPFLIFLIWRWQSEHDALSRPTPVIKLTVIGAGLVVLVMFALALYAGSGGGHKGEQYIPPQMIDGEIVPGHFVPIEEEAAEPDMQTDAPEGDDGSDDEPE